MARRSVLFTPGDRPDRMRKATETGADTLVFDLEDAVAPADKAVARDHVREILGEIDPACEVCVRVNRADVVDDDLDAILAGPGPDGIVLPKVESAGDVRTVARLLGERDADLPVLALVETAAGVLQADEIAAADPTDALLFGAEDLAADIGATRTADGTEVLYTRERVVVAAAAAGIDRIDTVYPDYEDTEGLAADAAFAVELGYDGKLVVHPAQVPVVNDAFAPDPDQLEWARRVLEARDATDRAVFEVDGEMIDAPLIAQAERIVERAHEARSDTDGG